MGVGSTDKSPVVAGHEGRITGCSGIRRVRVSIRAVGGVNVTQLKRADVDAGYDVGVGACGNVGVFNVLLVGTGDVIPGEATVCDGSGVVGVVTDVAAVVVATRTATTVTATAMPAEGWDIRSGQGAACWAFCMPPPR